MIEKRIRLENSRPQTPWHMHMPQRIIWKRDQLRVEQSPPDDLQLEDSEEHPEEVPNYVTFDVQMLYLQWRIQRGDQGGHARSLELCKNLT